MARAVAAAVLVALALCAAVAAADGSSSGNGTNWAVLVAGSSGWSNYRHQADVCHAYQLLHKNGVPDSQIIVMMYDDIAHNFWNKDKGSIINIDNGANVYPGVPKDYTKSEVSPRNFLNVLLGKDMGGKKTLGSGPNDNVFVYFADHGAPGLLAFPSTLGVVDHVLHADDLIKTLEQMAQNGKFKQLVFYTEACESGSVFNGLLPSNLNIYVTTAATPFESSYACDMNQHLGVYLSDCYSINWMLDAEKADLSGESLAQEYANVRNATTTSTVCQYGDSSFDSEPIGAFLSAKTAARRQRSAAHARRAASGAAAVSSRDVTLATLREQLAAETSETRQRLLAHLVHKELAHRLHADAVIERLAEAALRVDRAGAAEFVAASLRAPTDDQCHSQQQVAPIACLKPAVNAVERACGAFSDYSLAHVSVLRDLCALGVDAERIGAAAEQACAVHDA